ncbi:hypothetical protein HMPREF3034_00023 [Prevotella sp. DNF00663]|nr:hypothetical protein HMPREF3034_00023 [Prevotella sp. DNF00663]
MNGKKKNVDPRDYYRNLRKRDKSKFLQYLTNTYGMNINTIRAKLADRPHAHLTILEEITLVQVIISNSWKQ